MSEKKTIHYTSDRPLNAYTQSDVEKVFRQLTKACESREPSVILIGDFFHTKTRAL